MKRARATALALVNWEGVFYERYLLNQRVTALEGLNGAGKTTVMIACYAVLLPDLSLLRFTSIGEKGEQTDDKGIWGRLGNPSRPSYSILEITLADGETSILAGVQLEKKAEPKVEARCFLIRGLNTKGALAPVLLLTNEGRQYVPELTELQQNVARLGGRLQLMDPKEYFASLFELGITPLRLAQDDERRKLNEMLRSSMTGGISKKLTADLRSFLLKEESGLGATLVSMRATLDSCRRTRAEVIDAQGLEQEISGVFQAGEEMFAAALLAERERASTLRKRADDAKDTWRVADGKLTQLETEATSLLKKQTELQIKIDEADAALDNAKLEHVRVTKAHRLQSEMQALDEQLVHLRTEANALARALATAEQVRIAATSKRKRAFEDSNAAASGLHNHDAGLDELRRRAELYRSTLRQLESATTLTGRSTIDPADAGQLAKDLRVVWDDHDREIVRIARVVSVAAKHASEFAEVKSALESICEQAVADDVAHSVARRTLAELSNLEVLGASYSDLRQQRDDAEQRGSHQREAHEEATRLGFDKSATAAAVHEAFDNATTAAATLDMEERSLSTELDDTRRAVDTAVGKQQQLSDRREQWLAVDQLATRLGTDLGRELRNRQQLADGRRALLTRKADEDRRFADLTKHIEQLEDEAGRLERGDGEFSSELLRLRDELGAELVASRFDDVTLEKAAVTQAVLGPLMQGLIVDDTRTAATEVRRLDRPIETVVLVTASDVVDESAEIEESDRAVVVQERSGIRVSRLPEHPTLGRRARTLRVKDLRDEATAQTTTRDELDRSRQHTKNWLDELDRLLASAPTLEAGDPTEEIRALEKELGELETRVESLAARRKGLVVKLASARTRTEQLRAFMQRVHWLDPPDYAHLFEELRQRCASAAAARDRVRLCAKPRQVLGESIDVLRTQPLDASEVGRLEKEQVELERQRDIAFRAFTALEFVAENAVALAWTDAAQRLAEHQRLAEVLSTQAAEAQEQFERATAALTDAQGKEDEARGPSQAAAARVATQVEQRSSLSEQLAELAVEDSSAESVEVARVRVVAAEEEVKYHRSEERTVNDQRVAKETTREHQRGEVKRLSQDKEKLEAEAALAEDRWSRLQNESATHCVLGAVLSERYAELKGRGTVNLSEKAVSKRDALRDKLQRSKGGADIVEQLEQHFVGEAESADKYLAAWLAVRDWIRQRLPAQIAEVDDPVEALQRLRERLGSLRERLDKQEADLRTGAEGIASGIQVSIRRARNQVSRLNKGLAEVRFGIVDRIEVEVQKVETMELVLNALRHGTALEHVFDQTLPIEEALDLILRKYGGGHGSGKKLLDYREYIELAVRIRRRGQTIWELVNPAKLSTGEAIGVGASLMMVVLAEWEQDANFLRGKRATGSLRFLFLDEAARLSSDSLGVLFDLCDMLELQLLIAAPEIAQVEGVTTYRLVRDVRDDGQQTVRVSGRRAIAKS